MDEGLCTGCQRLEPIAEDGTIAKHTVWYTECGRWSQVPCGGVGLVPTEQEDV